MAKTIIDRSTLPEPISNMISTEKVRVKRNFGVIELIPVKESTGKWENLIYITADGEDDVEVIYADEDVWLSQEMIAVLYNVSVPIINEHLEKVFLEDDEGDFVVRIHPANGKQPFDQKNGIARAIFNVGKLGRFRTGKRRLFTDNNGVMAISFCTKMGQLFL